MELLRMGVSQGNKFMGNRLRSFRQAAQLTQTQLAELMNARCGMLPDQNAIKRVELGRQTLKLVEAAHLADIFGVTLDAFVWTKKMPKPKPGRVERPDSLIGRSSPDGAFRDANGQFAKKVAHVEAQ